MHERELEMHASVWNCWCLPFHSYLNPLLINTPFPIFPPIEERRILTADAIYAHRRSSNLVEHEQDPPPPYSEILGISIVPHEQDTS